MSASEICGFGFLATSERNIFSSFSEIFGFGLPAICFKNVACSSFVIIIVLGVFPNVILQVSEEPVKHLIEQVRNASSVLTYSKF